MSDRDHYFFFKTHAWNYIKTVTSLNKIINFTRLKYFSCLQLIVLVFKILPNYTGYICHCFAFFRGTLLYAQFILLSSILSFAKFLLIFNALAYDNFTKWNVPTAQNYPKTPKIKTHIFSFKFDLCLYSIIMGSCILPHFAGKMFCSKDHVPICL